jgi:hypothetical protein
MRILLLSKCIYFLFFLALLSNSCISPKTLDRSEIPPPYILSAGDGLIYDASITFKDFHASGLLVLKRIQTADYHVVLLSKFGPTIMEFKMDENGFKWIKTFDKLENKIVQNFIERDFRMILLSILENPKKVKKLKSSSDLLKYKIGGEIKAHIFIDPERNKVFYAENRRFINFFKTKVNFTYDKKEVPETITIKHNNMKMAINLNLLKKN